MGHHHYVNYSQCTKLTVCVDIAIVKLLSTMLVQSGSEILKCPLVVLPQLH